MKSRLLKFTLIALIAIHANAQPHPTFVATPNSGIHYLSKGNGNTPVIFVSGMSHDLSTWQVVQDSISKHALTISYDRAGLGLTKYHGEKKDLGTMVKELDELVRGVQVQQPFILVGHSMGCQIIKKYASMFPKKIKALVFIDPGYNPEQLKARISDSLWQVREKTLNQYMSGFNAAQREELANIVTNSEMADNIRSLPKVPVVFFTATMMTDFPARAMEIEVKKESHLQWLKSMPRAEHIFVDSSWHYIHNDTPGIVIAAIEKLLSR